MPVERIIADIGTTGQCQLLDRALAQSPPPRNQELEAHLTHCSCCWQKLTEMYRIYLGGENNRQNPYRRLPKGLRDPEEFLACLVLNAKSKLEREELSQEELDYRLSRPETVEALKRLFHCQNFLLRLDPSCANRPGGHLVNSLVRESLAQAYARLKSQLGPGAFNYLMGMEMFGDPEKSPLSQIGEWWRKLLCR